MVINQKNRLCSIHRLVRFAAEQRHDANVSCTWTSRSSKRPSIKHVSEVLGEVSGRSAGSKTQASQTSNRGNSLSQAQHQMVLVAAPSTKAISGAENWDQPGSGDGPSMPSRFAMCCKVDQRRQSSMVMMDWWSEHRFWQHCGNSAS